MQWLLFFKSLLLQVSRGNRSLRRRVWARHVCNEIARLMHSRKVIVSDKKDDHVFEFLCLLFAFR